MGGTIGAFVGIAGMDVDNECTKGDNTAPVEGSIVLVECFSSDVLAHEKE